MLVAQDFRDRARAALNGKWGVAVGTGFVASLLGAKTALSTSMGSGGSGSNADLSEEELEQLGSNEAVMAVFMAIMAVLGIILVMSLIISLIMFILSGPISLGYVKFNLDMVNGYQPRFKDLFSQFHRFGAGFVMQLLRNIFIFLWSLLFIIPGVIAAYKYAMAPYILYENPQMSGYEAIQKSKEMMDGNKWRFFCLNISFIGWGILTVFTCGIGNLWLRPYREAAYAAFYLEIKREKYGMSDYNKYEQGTAY